MVSFNTNTPIQTQNLGKYIAKFLPPGSVVALSGQLGSGKTTLVKGIAAGFGINPRQVNSPSYVLIKEYRSKRSHLFHCDLYRLNRLKQIASLGLEDYFHQNGVLVIEWAEKAAGLLPVEYLEIEIKSITKTKRRFEISSQGAKYHSLLKKIRRIKF